VPLSILPVTIIARACPPTLRVPRTSSWRGSTKARSLLLALRELSQVDRDDRRLEPRLADVRGHAAATSSEFARTSYVEIGWNPWSALLGASEPAEGRRCASLLRRARPHGGSAAERVKQVRPDDRHPAVETVEDATTETSSWAIAPSFWARAVTSADLRHVGATSNFLCSEKPVDLPVHLNSISVAKFACNGVGNPTLRQQCSTEMVFQHPTRWPDWRSQKRGGR
jgi:hypothetical protein